jgi:hypothetical protein
MKLILWWVAGQVLLVAAAGQDDTTVLRDELRRLAQPSPSEAISSPSPGRSVSAGQSLKPREGRRASSGKETSLERLPIGGTYYGHTDILVNQDHHVTCPTRLEFNPNTNSALVTVNYNGTEMTTTIAGSFRGEIFHGRSEGRFFGLVYVQAMNYAFAFNRRSGTVAVTSWAVNPPSGSSPSVETDIYRRNR